MAATTWLPLINQNRRQWRLTDGAILTEPVIEESGSGRRIRLAGSKQSHSQYEKESLAFSWVLREALVRGQQVLCEHHTSTFGQPNADGAPPFFTHPGNFPAPYLHLVDSPSRPGYVAGPKITNYWWHFRCKEVPEVQVQVSVMIRDEYTPNRQLGASRVVTTAMFADTPGIAPYSGVTHVDPDSVNHNPPPTNNPTNNAFSEIGWGSISDPLHRFLGKSWPLREAEVAKPGDFEVFANWPENFTQQGNDRRILAEALKRVREWDEIDSFPIPNFAKVAWPDVCKEQPDTWTLELVRSNVTNDVIENLAAMVEGFQSVQDALTHFQGLQRALRDAGLVLADLRGSDLLALLGNQGERLTVQVQNVVLSGDAVNRIDQAGGHVQSMPPEHEHTVSVDLVTGMFVLNCKQRALDDDALLNKTAAAWDEARTVASITGEEPALLAFARARAAAEQQRGHQAVVDAIQHH